MFRNPIRACVVSSLALLSLIAAAQPAPTRTFAPYVDMTKITLTLPQLQAASGTNLFTLAFLVSGKTCEPAWGGTAPISADTKVLGEITQLRASGGDVILAFGGYDGLELAQTCTDVPTLQAAYQAVVDKYKAKVLDLDIEHTAIEDPVSIDRRSQALTALAAANPGLRINYTLPATPAGMTDLSVNVIKSAVKFATPVAVVNLMTMDYGSPVVTGAMGPNAVAAASGAAQQLKSVGLKARIGITPMIGVNDTPGETFTLDDAQVVVNYALANGNSVGLLAFWSIGRDNGSCTAQVSAFCSGITQKDWEFTRIFQKFH